jgi:hypothetical protein
MEQHTNFSEKIALWLDNELSPTEIVEVQTHLVHCTACRDIYQTMKQTDVLLRQAATVLVEPTPGFTARFETRLAQHQTRRRWQVWLGMSALGLGSLIFLAIGITGLGLTLFNLWSTLLNVNLLYYGLGELGSWVSQIRILVNLGEVGLKVLLLALRQPLFWVSLPALLVLAWLWVRLLRFPGRHLSSATGLMI